MDNNNNNNEKNIIEDENKIEKNENSNNEIRHLIQNNDTEINEILSNINSLANFAENVTDSFSRDETVSETYKKRIYKQALNINNVSLISPKLQRIHEGVSKVFGLDDPPPGFGLAYPKYYYLEQKRPQPMSPLKVWRGFNGNIYFEPIHLNNINSSNSVVSNSNTTLTASTGIINNNNNNPTTTTNNNNNQTVLYSTKEIENTDGNVKTETNTSLKSRSQNKIYSTKQNESYADISSKDSRLNANKENSTLLFEEVNNSSDIHLLNNIQHDSSFLFKEKLDTMSSSSLITNKKQTKFNMLSELTRPKFQTSNSPGLQKDFILAKEPTKLKINNQESNKSILPNLAAVKRGNIPLRGLAFKEAKQRITYSSNDFSKENDFNFKPDAAQAGQRINYADHFKLKLSPEEFFQNNYVNNIVNNNYIKSEASQKPTYKEMLKNIRKGVTINLNMNNNGLNKNDDANASLQNDSKFLLLSDKLKNANIKHAIKHKNFKILKIKGDRIASVEILSKTVPIDSAKKIKIRDYLASKTSLLDKEKLSSSSNNSLQSNISAQSQEGRNQNLKRINPSPEMIASAD